MAMTPTLDLNLISLQRQEGKENPQHPGLFMASPPRKTARGRNSDLLIIYLTMSGNSPIDERSQEQILERLAQLFYKTQGSMTAALKTIAEQLNKFLLDRNLRSTSTGHQGVGLLTLAVLKDEKLTLGFCGPTHAYLVKADGTQHLHDPEISGRGLGLTRSINIRFFQTNIKPNDILVMSPQPPAAWKSETLQNIHGQGIDSLRRKLLAQVGPNLNAFVVYAQSGTGKLRLIKTQPAVQMVQQGSEQVDEAEKSRKEETSHIPPTSLSPVQITEKPAAAPKPTQVEKSKDDDLDFLMPFEETEETPEVYSAQTGQKPIEETEVKPEDLVEVKRESTDQQIEPPGKKEKKERAFSGLTNPIKAQVAKSISFLSTNFAVLGSYFTAVFRWFARLLLKLLKRILPDESIFSIPAGTMAFTAVAVAIVIATAGAVMYFQKGRAQQYQSFYEQAMASAETARGQLDPVELRTSWDTTLFYLNKADSYMVTYESNNLRQTALQALDELDYIYRLNFKPTFIGGLGSTANITRLAATHNELYIFNANGGTIFRATLTGNGYTIDSNFNCSPNPTIGEIVDVAILPQGNSLKANIMAMDIHGNLMLCSQSEPPRITSLAPPHTGWSTPTAFVLDNNHLYVLDPPKNAVWIYWNMDFTNPPHLYFGDSVPQMDDVIDMAVNRDDLYLLHNDGRTTTCKYSRLRESPTRCDDPAGYYDPRPGRQSGVYILDALFQQILYTPSPDSSIYMLDSNNLSVYHFSLRLNLQRQFRSTNTLGGDTATAFAVSPNRTLFLATGSQVYFSQMP
jgi:hypothetical protein